MLVAVQVVLAVVEAAEVVVVSVIMKLAKIKSN